MNYLYLIYHEPVAPGAAALVRAQDLNRAIQCALRIPQVHSGAVEIWRIAAGAFPPQAMETRIEEKTVKYLCLVYSEEQKLHSLPDSPEDTECQAYAESVAATGRMLAAEALQPVEAATTVRMRSGAVSITDGPFAETKEQLAGFYLVDADNLDQALEIAAGIPAARVGSVEVRPVRQLQVESE